MLLQRGMHLFLGGTLYEVEAAHGSLQHYVLKSNITYPNDSSKWNSCEVVVCLRQFSNPLKKKVIKCPGASKFQMARIEVDTY
mmetsp:Transcript_22428/g.34699  ORF Transcript_22428/g.34699 Transcript_22428/m.34699 type:complete len:83 (+) Transcript_22428:503-751(+)